MVGLSSRTKVASLLSTVGNKSTKKKTTKPEPEVDALPLSTDDEGEDDGPGISLSHRSSPKKGSRLTDLNGSDSDSSFAERHSKAAIRPTKFGAKRSLNESSRDGQAKRSKVSDDDEAWSTRKTNDISSSRRSATPNSSGDHFKDRHGFVTTKTGKSTYRKRNIPSSAKPLPKSKKSNKKRDPDPVPSPQKGRAAHRTTTSPPTKPKPTQELSDLANIFDESDSGDSISATTKALIKSKTETTYKPKTKKAKDTKAKRDSLDTSSPSHAVSTTSPDLLDTGRVSHSFNLTEDAQSELDAEEDVSVLKATAFEAEKSARCPWCGAEVDSAQLEKFSRGKKRLTVQMQTKFCAIHKKQAAKDEWKARGYPEISWDRLEERFIKYSDDLLGIVQGNQSHFRQVHEEKMKKGRSRTLKEADNFNPGYYGPQGLNVMSDFVVKEFSNVIKERAIIDRVISGRGSAAFIQSVLVAELAVRMIMEDMGVDKVKARSILEESRDIGETVNED